ncbi:MAG: class I SAM-dependent methyltransferase [Afipia sp.]|nr:class I SAM-dependent methyltransferase [Afipia sp.]
MSRRRKDATKFVQAFFRGFLRRKVDEKGQVELFVPPGHFYSPIVNVQEADWHLNKREAEPMPETLPGIALDQREMIEEWKSLLPYLTTVPFPNLKNPQFRYAFDNPAYAWGDGSILHAILRKYRPKRLIEVGSGWSSACIFDSVEQYLDGACELTFIEPHPQLLRDLLGEVADKVRILESPVQRVTLDVFEALEAGDVLFIDSTHVLRTGSDVCFELFDILPRLTSGVLVHIHDMFWPFEYPRQWVIDENRSWNELYAVRAFLSNNDAWRIVMFNDYLARTQRPLIEATYPNFLRNSGGALWLQRR